MKYQTTGIVKYHSILGWVVFLSATPAGFAVQTTGAGPAVLNPESFQPYVATFNKADRESVAYYIPNAGAWDWMAKNVPLLDCPDEDLEEIYYFRWWSYRKHIKETPDGFVVTEFLPQVGWSKQHNTINCPIGHHLYEGRWIHDPKFLDDYTRFYFGKGGDPGGVVVPWIDESLNPDTGAWITNGDRGANYNHSTYCDLIISGLIGLRPRADDTIEVNPLLPDGVWDYFCLDNVRYHSRIITILYDKTGQRYGKGKGLQVLADGQRIASSDSLQRLTGSLSR